MERNLLCPVHSQKIEWICFYITKCKKDKKCPRRLLCQTCNNVENHEKHHRESTLRISRFITEDMSETFFTLFFSVPQIKTLFTPLTVNSESILSKLNEMERDVMTFTVASSRSNSQLFENTLEGQVEDPQQQALFIENAKQKIQTLAERINSNIEYVHQTYREQFDWQSFNQLISMYYQENKITQEQMNTILNSSIDYIHCTLIFMRNVYVIDDNLNLSSINLNQNQSVLPALTISDLISCYKCARRDLFLNLNHIRCMYSIFQPSQLKSIELCERLPLVTNFPINIQRFLPTVSMEKIHKIKLVQNKLIILRQYECLIVHLDPSSLEIKLQNTIYSKKPIKDASISLCDDNQITLLCGDSAIIYQMKPYVSVLDNEQITLMEFGSKSETFIGLDFIKPQKENMNEEKEEVQDYVALKTSDTIFLIEPLEWTMIDSCQNSQELFRLEVTTEQQDGDNDDSMEIETKKRVICFYQDQQLDLIHFSFAQIFKENQILGYAYSPALSTCVYLTDSDMIIATQESTKLKPMKNKPGISYMDFTADNLYLFVFYENSLIQFFYVVDFELEYETHLCKSQALITKVVFSSKLNQLFILNSDGELFSLELSSPKKYL